MAQKMVTLTNSKLEVDGEPAVAEVVAESVDVWKTKGWKEVEDETENASPEDKVPNENTDSVSRVPASTATTTKTVPAEDPKKS